MICYIEVSFIDSDLICYIEVSFIDTALQLAQKLGVKYSEGLIKNRYIARTFIMPEQKQRKKSVNWTWI